MYISIVHLNKTNTLNSSKHSALMLMKKKLLKRFKVIRKHRHRNCFWAPMIMFFTLSVLSLFCLSVHGIFIQPEDLKQSYDFIVVGAGAAGCNVASKLVRCGSVLLVEEGGLPPWFTNIPLLAPIHLDSAIDRKFTVYSDGNFFIDNNMQAIYHAGKCLGGSSQLNWFIALRGSRQDYNDWEHIHGAEGWGYDNVLQYFKYDENNSFEDVSDAYHGRRGPVAVNRQQFKTSFHSVMSSAYEELGYQQQDPNSDQLKGYFDAGVTISHGKRVSSSSAFLEPLAFSKNLHILLHATVEKIVVKNDRAVGIIVTYAETKQLQVKASLEIILSAGVIRSPQILMLSGIGPKPMLDKIGVKIVKELPGVGQNFQNHVDITSTLLMDNFNQSFAASVGNNGEELIKYFKSPETYKGPLTAPAGYVPPIGFVRTKTAQANGEDADIEIAAFLSTEFHESQYCDEFSDPNIFRPQFHAPLLRPKSRGWIELVSSDIRDKPKIFPNYFNHSDDLTRSIEGMRIVIDLMRTNAMKQAGIRWFAKAYPSCKEHWSSSITAENGAPSNAYLECTLRHVTQQWMHGSGTCRMGNVKDTDTVVNSRLRVKGIANLRVADTSIMPQLISGHTYLPAIMIGAKAADLICMDHGFASFLNNVQK